MKYFIIRIIFFLTVLMASLNGRAQNIYGESNFFNITSADLLIYEPELTEFVPGEGTFRSGIPNKISGGYGIESLVGYYIGKSFSLGLGTGYHRYPEIDVNAVPLFLDARIMSKEFGTSFLYAKIGSFIRLNDRFVKGSSLEAGAGYKFLLSEKTPMLFNIFINAAGMSLTDQPYSSSPQTVNTTTVGFKLGFIF